DSITEGYAPSAAGVDRLTQGYPAAFLKYCEENGKEVIVGNYGVSASGFLPSNGRFYGDLVTWNMISEETDPDIVFFAMGTNDAQGSGGTNGALAIFEENFRYFITTMGNIPSVDNVYITNAIFRKTSSPVADHRASAVMRPTQERVAKELAAKDSKYVFVDLFGLTLDAALSDELFKDDNGVVNERLHPARAGLDLMGLCCYNAAFNGVYAPEEYHLTDIYVSDSGSTYGAGTATDPIANIGYAFDLMERNANVTLHIVGTSTWVGGKDGGNAYVSVAPSKITIVGEGEDAVIVTPLANTFKIGTDTKIDNVTLKTGTSAVSIIGCFNNVEITDTVKTEGTWSFYAGYNVFANVDPSTTATFDNVASASSDKDCTVTINGGNYATFVFGNGRFASNAPFGTYSGTLTASVGEGITMNGAYVGVNGHNYLTGTINADIKSWSGDVKEYAAHGSTGGGITYDFTANTGDVNITLAEGMTNKVLVALDFDGSGEYDFADFMMAVKYLVDGFDTNKAGNFYGDSIDSLLDVLVLAKKLV
ncbi:MAG: SGNH/GDSL hydrolase family protein, partial [Clostridia bacterium]|nr:SGNH/GDSL hydrolase family protein [Clostridia bacterium]